MDVLLSNQDNLGLSNFFWWQNMGEINIYVFLSYSYRRQFMRSNLFYEYFLRSLISTLVLLNFVCVASSNLLVNGDFSMKNLMGLKYKYVIGGVEGWNCTSKCEIDDCLKLNQFYQLQSSFNAACTGQVIDLTSDSIQNVTQQITLTSGDYSLSLNYYYPRVNAHYKTLLIYFNEQLIYSFTPNVSSLFQSFYFQAKVKGISGSNILRLTNKNNGGNDVFGYSINNVSLVAFTQDWINNILNATLFNPIANSLIQFPGYKTIFGDLASLFVNFDRIQFYYFHNRSYSFYSYLLLSRIKNINNVKGASLRKIYQLFDPAAEENIQKAFFRLDKKQIYTPQYMLQRGLKSEGMFSNMYAFFAYNIPGTIIVYGILFGTFHLIKSRPVSRLIRKYSFSGIFFFMLLDGNVESLTYFTMKQLRIFFSADSVHKITNILLLYFYFAVCFICVGSLLWMRCIYKSRIVYLLENRRESNLGLTCYIIDNGLIAVIFGTLHQLLLTYPNAQLAALILFQCMWIMTKIYMIWKQIYRFFGIQSLLLFSGFIRVCLILTIFSYQKYQQERGMINSQIHKTIVIIFVILWVLELILSLFQIFFQFSSFCKKKIFTSKSISQGEIHTKQDLIKFVKKQSISFKLIKANILKIIRTNQSKYCEDILNNQIMQQRIKRMINHNKE